MISYVPAASSEENQLIMRQACQAVKSGEVTVAVRDAHYGDLTIHKGEYMGIGSDQVLSVSADLKQAVLDLILALADEDAEFVTIYYGEAQAAEEAETIMEQVTQALPDVDVAVINGNYAIPAGFIASRDGLFIEGS